MSSDDEGMMLFPIWVVLYIEKDDSYILILDTNVVCLERPCKVGNVVKCFYNGSQYEGKVMGTGDHDSMEKKLKDLNKNRRLAKKEDSFHEDRPRKAAEKCKSWLSRSGTGKKPDLKQIIKDAKPAALSSIGKKINPVSHEMSPKSVLQVDSNKSKATESKKIHSTEKPKEQLVAQSSTRHSSDEDFEVISADESSGSESEVEKSLTIKDLMKLQELSKKHHKTDLQSLLNLAAQEKQGKKSKVDKGESGALNPKSEREVKVQGGKRKADEAQSLKVQVKQKKSDMDPKKCKGEATGKIKSDAAPSREIKATKEKPSQIKIKAGKEEVLASKMKQSDTSSDDDSSSGESEQDEPSPKKSKRASDALIFEGQMYLWTAKDNNVEELGEDTGVFINSKELKRAKSSATSCTFLARVLMRKVFTSEALLACSVKGQQASGKGKENAEVRPSLDPDGVDAIVAYAQKRALKKKWREVSESQCRTAMGSLLCENRHKIKANEKRAAERKLKLENLKVDKMKKDGKNNEDGNESVKNDKEHEDDQDDGASGDKEVNVSD